jgi:hypothetical protein
MGDDAAPAALNAIVHPAVQQRRGSPPYARER